MSIKSSPTTPDWQTNDFPSNKLSNCSYVAGFSFVPRLLGTSFVLTKNAKSLAKYGFEKSIDCLLSSVSVIPAKTMSISSEFKLGIKEDHSIFLTMTSLFNFWPRYFETATS